MGFILRTGCDLTRLALTSERLRLVSLTTDFAEEIFREFTPEVTRYMMPPPAKKIDETLAFITTACQGMEQGRDLVLAITDKQSGEFIGCCGLHLRDTPRTPEFGIWTKKSAHGHGYGREAVHLLAGWAVAQLEFDYAIYPVDQANRPSRNIAESLGGRLTGEMQRVETMVAGRYLDEVVYHIPRAEIAERVAVVTDSDCEPVM